MSKQIDKSSLVGLEVKLENLKGEIETSTVSHLAREEISRKLLTLNEMFKGVVSGQSSPERLEAAMAELDMYIAEACVVQAEQEISKAEVGDVAAQAIANVKYQLNSGNTTPSAARREVKKIVRHHRF